MHDDNLDKDFVTLKFHRDMTSYTSVICEFKMALLDNGDPEEFLSLVFNFNMTLAVSVTLGTDMKV